MIANEHACMENIHCFILHYTWTRSTAFMHRGGGGCFISQSLSYTNIIRMKFSSLFFEVNEAIIFSIAINLKI